MTAARWTKGILERWLVVAAFIPGVKRRVHLGSAAIATALALSLAAGALPGQTSDVNAGRTRIAVGGVDPGGLSVLDASTLSTIARIDGLEQVHGSAISTDGRLAYAMNMVDPARAVTVVDVEAASIVRSVPLPGPSHHAAVSPSDGRLYVAYGRMGLDPERPRGLAVLSRRGERVKLLETEGTPYYLVVSPDASRLYVAIQHPNRILVLRLPDLEREGAVPLGAPPGHLAVARGEDALFAVVGSDEIVRIDPEEMAVDGRASAGPDAHSVALAGRPHHLFVGNRAPGTVTVVDPASMTALGTREVTPMLTHLLALENGTLLASGGGGREVLLLSAGTLDVLHRANVPFQPHQSARAAAVR